MPLTKSAKSKRKENDDKMTLDIDVGMCDVLIKYSMSKYPTKAHLANLSRLLSVLDMDSYNYNYDIHDKLALTKLILDQRIEKGITSDTLIKYGVNEADPTLAEKLNSFDFNAAPLSTGDCKNIAEFVDEKMQFYFFYSEMPKIIELWKSCALTKFNTNSKVLNEVSERMSRLAMKMQSTSIGTSLLTEFNFANPRVEDAIKFVVRRAQQPSSILQTGIRQLNAILGPGFRGGKLYTILGMSGRFKSGTLLNIADQITKFNPQLEPVVDGVRNTLLFITMENTIDETIERIFNMYADSDADFLTTSPEEICRVIREVGKYNFTDKMGIDIEFRYYANMAIKTSQIYHIINDMESRGQHVIGVILDYIKRIDTEFNHGGDETLRVTYAAKELKSIAEFYNIPVITAQQINRMGNATVDSAMKSGKKDLIRFLGNSDIGGAWGVIEESDWVAIINLEKRESDGRMFLTIKRTKQRAGANDVTVSDYFNQPFANDRELRLETDVDKEASVSVCSLASDLVTVDMGSYENTTQERPKYKIDEGDQTTLFRQLGIAAAA